MIEELKMCWSEMEGLGGRGSGRGGERIYKLKCGRLDTKTQMPKPQYNSLCDHEMALCCLNIVL